MSTVKQNKGFVGTVYDYCPFCKKRHDLPIYRGREAMVSKGTDDSYIMDPIFYYVSYDVDVLYCEKVHKRFMPQWLIEKMKENMKREYLKAKKDWEKTI